MNSAGSSLAMIRIVFSNAGFWVRDIVEAFHFPLALERTELEQTMKKVQRKTFILMELADGYAALDDSPEPELAGGGTLEEIIEYLQLSGAQRKDIFFAGEFNDDTRSKIFSSLPLSVVK